MSFDYAYTYKLDGLDDMNFHYFGLSFKFGSIRDSVKRVIEAAPPEIVIQYLKSKDYVMEPKDQVVFIEKLNIVGKISSDRNILLDTMIIKLNNKQILKKKYINNQKYDLNEEIILDKGFNELEVI